MGAKAEAAPAPTETPAAAPAEATPAQPESMQEAMDRIAAAAGEESAETPEAAPEGGKEAKGKGEPEKPQTPAEIEQLKALAQKLGYQLEDAAVTNAERAEWRKMRKAHTEAIKAAEAEAGNNIAELRKVAEAEITLGKEIKEARKNRDYNRLAKLLEFDDWNKLQDDVIAATTDPNYQKILELEAWKAEQEKTEAARREQAKREAEQQAKIAAQQKYRGELSAGMKNSTDKLVKAFADDPSFVNIIYRIQEENWDGGAQVITPERAIHMKPSGSQVTVYDELKGIRERLNLAFGEETQAEEPAKAKGAPAKRTPERPKPPAPSAPKNDESRQDFMRRLGAALDEASAEERIQARKQRAGVA